VPRFLYFAGRLKTRATTDREILNMRAIADGFMPAE
jgi:hypothetical protein